MHRLGMVCLFILTITPLYGDDVVCKPGPIYSYCDASMNGPDKWYRLDPKWEACSGSTLQQSPIAISSGSPVTGKLEQQYASMNLTVTNTSHSIKIYAPEGSALTMKTPEGEWKLVEFHFHVPAEHRVSNVPGNIVGELHFVHSYGVPARSGAIGVLLALSPDDNPALTPILNALPNLALCSRVNTGASFNPATLLPAPALGPFFAYNGSLTTPECTPVRWFVLTKTIPISQPQLTKLNVFYGNARPPQPAPTPGLMRYSGQ